jgi:glycosyltransferase involved in cell wall biosynthesis
MKILMVISQFHPIIGGAEKQAQLLAKKLIEKGIDVNIITGWWKQGTPRREIINGIQIFRNFSCFGMFGIKGIRTLSGLIYMFTLWLYLLIHRREYDIMHVHQALYPAFVSVFVGKQILGKPVIVKTASSGVTSDIKQLKKYPFGDTQLRYLIRKMDFLAANSRVGGDEFKAIGLPESRIVFIPNGVEIPEGKIIFQGNVRHVLTVARLSHEKGIDVLLKAWAKVAALHSTPKLIIAGQGPLGSELKKLCKDLGLADCVKFVGSIPNVNEQLINADLFVLPSRTEGLSNALLEAMSHGLPCIATNVGGNFELFGENEQVKITPGTFVIARNGLLVNPDDVEGMSEAILCLIGNESERQNVGNRGKLYIRENYSIDLITDKYIELYQRMVGEKS